MLKDVKVLRGNSLGTSTFWMSLLLYISAWLMDNWRDANGSIEWVMNKLQTVKWVAFHFNLQERNLSY